MGMLDEFRIIRTLSGRNVAPYDFPIEGAPTTSGSGGQDFVPGQILVMNASELVQEAKDNEEVVLGVASDAAEVGGTALAQDDAVGVFIFNADTVFEGTPTTPANVVSRQDTGNSAAVWQSAMDFNRTADTNAGVHTINENAADDQLFMPIDVDLTTGRVRLIFIAGMDCQGMSHLTGALGTAVFAAMVTADT